MEVITVCKNKCILINKIKIDTEHGFIISKLKKCTIDSFIFNKEDNLWYYKNYKSLIKLFDLFYPDNKNTEILFLNNDINDYRQQNIKIIKDNKYNNLFPEPNKYIIELKNKKDIIEESIVILQYGIPNIISEGRYSGEYRNMYWKVINNNEDIYYLMHIKTDIYTKISIKDINKLLIFKNRRPTWRLFQNGYIACAITCDINNHELSSSSNQKINHISDIDTPIDINEKQKVYYLHQVIMDLHDEDLTDYTRTIDHINHDKLDNRSENLRIVDMSVQNSNRDKSERRCDAIDLPDGIIQSDLPKYIVYRKEILNKETNRYREYFYICNHPKLKRWETTKSNKVSNKDKLNMAIQKLNNLELSDELQSDNELSQSDNELSESDTIKNNNKLILPLYINLVTLRDNKHFIYDNKQKDFRYNLTMILKSDNLKNELKIFIDKINKKYPELKLENNLSNNDISNDDISNNNILNNDIIKLNLPNNFSFYKEKSKYYFQYAKTINKNKIGKKITINSNNIQSEFDKFIELLNNIYPELKLLKYIIPNIPSISIISSNIEQTSINSNKPIMPKNISITTVNNIDYIQFCKKINNKKFQYKQKINSYNLQEEINRFINQLNTNYILNLDKNNYIINNNNWKTTNTIKL